MKAIIGEAPLLPWWRVATMSDAEIREFNNSFYVEVEMTDDSLDDTQQSSVGTTKLEIALLDVVTKNAWNAAIEEAAACVELTSTFGEMGRMAEEIRKLKK